MPLSSLSLTDYFDDHATLEAASTLELARYLRDKLDALLEAGAEIHDIDFESERQVEIRYQLTFEQAIGPMNYTEGDLEAVLLIQFGMSEMGAEVMARTLARLGEGWQGDPKTFRQAFQRATVVAPAIAAQALDRWPEVVGDALTMEDLTELLTAENPRIRHHAVRAARRFEHEGKTDRPGPKEPKNEGRTPGR